MKITTLCFGNINRSPAAKYALERSAANAGLDIVVDSCGTSSYNAGKSAAKRMRDAMGRRDFDLTDHKAKQITEEIIAESDIIVYMDGSNYRKMLKMFSPEILGNKLVQLSKYMPYDDIDDPHFAKADVALETYETVVTQIIESSDALIQEIKNGTDPRGDDPRVNNSIFGW